MTSPVYESIKEHAPDDLMLNIKAILMFHVGREYSITKEQISMKLFNKYTETTDRNIRDAVSDLVIWFNEHIVTNTVTGGFYYASTEDEINENIADCRAREKMNRLRAEGLERAREHVFYRGHKNANPAQARLI